MSTIVTGEAKDVFIGLHEAFDRAAATGHVVMTVTYQMLVRFRNIVVQICLGMAACLLWVQRRSFLLACLS
jgi:hypothetical protein